MGHPELAQWHEPDRGAKITACLHLGTGERRHPPGAHCQQPGRGDCPPHPPAAPLPPPPDPAMMSAAPAPPAYPPLGQSACRASQVLQPIWQVLSDWPSMSPSACRDEPMQAGREWQRGDAAHPAGLSCALIRSRVQPPRDKHARVWCKGEQYDGLSNAEAGSTVLAIPLSYLLQMWSLCAPWCDKQAHMHADRLHGKSAGGRHVQECIAPCRSCRLCAWSAAVSLSGVLPCWRWCQSW